MYFNRGVAWARKKEYDRAITDYTESIRLEPIDHHYKARADAWHRKKEYDKAIVDYRRATSLNPKSADAYNSLAWLQATCPDQRYRDGKMALENGKFSITP